MAREIKMKIVMEEMTMVGTEHLKRHQQLTSQMAFPLGRG
jgi:hypothetical protein